MRDKEDIIGRIAWVETAQKPQSMFIGASAETGTQTFFRLVSPHANVLRSVISLPYCF